jgi:tetratricopeptide (TPR) repeat protein
MRADCPSEDQLLAYAQGIVAPEEAARLEAHLASCESCPAVVAAALRELAGSGSQPAAGDSAAPAVLADGARLGRYAILELVGRGAMGVVYAAYDPQLDRRVALKVLRALHQVGDAEALGDRLLREGQSMARLSHPNVVAVYDAGATEDGIFLAMELVEGETLRAWLARAPRSWREVLGMFIEAGRGLAAAHAAGLVHRDFKPDNVLVGRDGRARVTDFGLARVRAGERPASPEPRLLTLTATGALVGTPAFMAPEQLRGEEAGAPADIFAFAAALFQALFHELPFAGDSFAAHKDAVLAGRLREPASAHGVPAHVRRALRRGLAVAAGDRFASMDDFLRALAAEPLRRAGRAALLAAPILLAVGMVVWRWAAPSAAAPCQGGAARLAGVWDDGSRASLRAAFAATGAPYAATSAARVVSVLDGYGDAWVAAYTDACEASSVRHEQSAALLDRRMQCLDDRLRDVAATVDTLRHADQAVLDRAPAAVAGLRPLEACADRQRLLAVVAPPEDPSARARVDGVRMALARARALRMAGRYAEGLPVAAAAVDDARAVGYPPALAESLYERGSVERLASQMAASRQSFRAAVDAAERAGDDELVVGAVTGLVHALGFDSKLDEAITWAGFGQAKVARLGNDPLKRAALLGAEGNALLLSFRNDQALPQLEEAEALLEHRLGANHPDVAGAMNRLHMAYQREGRYADSVHWGLRALGACERLYGSEHPETANVLSNLGVPLKALGARHQALEVLGRSLAIRERRLGPAHREVAIPLSNLSQVELELGLYREAVASSERAVAITEAALGRDHPQLITILANLCMALPPVGRGDDAQVVCARLLALVEAKLGKQSPAYAFVEDAVAVAMAQADRWDQACALFDRAVADLLRSQPGHSDLGTMLDGQGRCQARRGQLRPALALYQRSLAITEKAFGPRHSDLGPTLIDVGDAELGVGDAAAAVAAFERAVAVLGKAEIDPLEPAEAELGLARALRAAHAQPERAEALARDARRVLLASPYTRAELRKKAEEER